MRKFILAAVSCVAILATSCNTPKSNSLDQVEIAGNYTADNTDIRLNGSDYDLRKNQAITVSGNDLDKMSVVIPAGFFKGEDEIVFDGISFDPNDDYSFEGVVTNEDRTIRIEGYYADNGLKLEANSEYTSPIIGVWNVMAPNNQMVGEGEEATEKDISEVLHVKVKTESGKLTFMGSEQTCANFEDFFNVLGQGMLRSYDEAGNYTGLLRNVTFHKDGNLTVEYNKYFMSDKAPVYVKSPLRATNWYAKDNKVYLYADLDIMNKAEISTHGLPMEYKVENGVACIYFTKKQIAPVMSLVNLIASNIIADDAEGLAPIVKMAIKELKTISLEASEFSFGLTFEKSVTE